MIDCKIKGFLLLLGMFYLTGQSLFSQDHKTKNNYTGAWGTPASWDPAWPAPQNSVNDLDITINGYITANNSLTFSGGSSKLIVDDTLVIVGNLTIEDDNEVQVNNNGILIVRGNLTFSNKSKVTVDGYIIVTGNLIKEGSINNGKFVGDKVPINVFIGGTISPAELTDDKSDFELLNCTSPADPYPHSGCSYGDMTDIISDPIYPFFQTTCIISTPTISAGGPTTFCAGGSVTLTSSSGTSYLWSTGETTPSINVNSLGSYTVKVTNINGCQSASSVVKQVIVNNLPAIPSITSSGPLTFCAGGNVALTSSSGTSYLWSTGATTQNINVTSAGNYTVKVKNANGCESAASLTSEVIVNSLPTAPSISASGPLIFCNGDSVTLTSSAGTSYLWSTGEITPEIKVKNSGNYSVKIKNTNGCESAFSAISSFTVNDLPAAPIVTALGSTNFCSGSNVILSSETATNYLWSTGETTTNIKVKNSGNYSVRVKDANGCESASSVIKEVIVNVLPEAPIVAASGSLIFCKGDSVNLNSGAGISYLWSTGETSPTINVKSSDVYTVKIKDENGCESAPSAIAKVIVNSLPAKPTISALGPLNFCSGDNVILSSSASKSYLWSTGENTQNIKIENPGSYSVKVTDTNGCESANSENIEIVVKSLPETPVIAASDPLTFCAGENVTLTSSEGINYLWSTGAKTQAIQVKNSGNITVKVKNEDGCESVTSLAMSVEVLDLPEVRFTSTNEPMCSIDSRLLTASPAGGVFNILSGPGSINSNVLKASSSGNIVVEYNYSDKCANKSTQTIIVNEQPVSDAGPDQDLKFIFETQMNAELSGNETGEWSMISGNAKIIDVHSPATRISRLSAGDYALLWTVKNGACVSASEVKIIVHDVFIPSAITPNGDGRNDYFMVDPFIGKAELIIFNRWGNEEFRNTNYSNDWDGRNNKGKLLPDDTYFYVIKFENDVIKKGTVLIKSR